MDSYITPLEIVTKYCFIIVHCLTINSSRRSRFNDLLYYDSYENISHSSKNTENHN